MSGSSDDEDIDLTPLELREQVVNAELNFLPEKSREKYLKAYTIFNEWKLSKGAKTCSETVLLSYFMEASKTRQASTLWSIFSMLKATIKSKHNVHIETFPKLLAFLKRTDGYKSKKSRVFTASNIEKFLNEAPDCNFLATKLPPFGREMARVCCVAGCDSADDGRTFFPFPVAPSLRRSWLAALPASSLYTPDASVCSRHFAESDYDTVRGKVRLRGKVVPCRFGETAETTTPSCNDKPTPKSATDADDEQNKQNGKTEKVKRRRKKRKAKRRRRSSTEDTDDSEQWPVEMADDDCPVGDEVLVTPDLGELMAMAEEAGDAIECVPELPVPESGSDAGAPPTDDIEDIIANYHIKQDKELAERLKEAQMVERERLEKERREKERQEKKERDRLEKERKVKMDAEQQESLLSKIAAAIANVEANAAAGAGGRRVSRDSDVVEVVQQDEFVEIDVGGTESNRDCLMLMESVQVLLDPTELLHSHDHQHGHGHEQDNSQSLAPVSLLTSSDDDDVILQEPHIDTVEVSDETDEDDVPLVKIAKRPLDKDSPIDLFGTKKDYFCYQCNWVTFSRADFDRHRQCHTRDIDKEAVREKPKRQKVIRVCDVCHFSTASEVQFNRHRKKHKEEKKYQCSVCSYRAKHRMSLTYHMRAHAHVHVTLTATTTTTTTPLPLPHPHPHPLVTLDDQRGRGRDRNRRKKKYRCKGCRLSTTNKAEIVRHSRVCRKRHLATKLGSSSRVLRCNECEYSTRRPSDLQRHKRKHENVDKGDDDNKDEDDDYVPR